MGVVGLGCQYLPGRGGTAETWRGRAAEEEEGTRGGKKLMRTRHVHLQARGWGSLVVLSHVIEVT